MKIRQIITLLQYYVLLHQTTIIEVSWGHTYINQASLLFLQILTMVKKNQTWQPFCDSVCIRKTPANARHRISIDFAIKHNGMPDGTSQVLGS